MTPASLRIRRRRLAPLVALCLALLATVTVSADQPDPAAQWQAHSEAGRVAIGPDWADLSLVEGSGIARDDAALAQDPEARTCADVRPADTSQPDSSLAFTDADLLDEGDGTRLCLFFDQRWGTYGAWMLGPRTLEEFRRAKAELQPLLDRAGVDACRVAFWSSLDRELRRQLTLRDRFDAGQPCTPEIQNHGLQGQFRQGEIESGLTAAMRRAEEVFGWKLAWPLRAHTYDTEEEFAVGLTREGGFTAVSARAVAGVGGVTAVLANGGFGYLINIRRFQDAAALQTLIAHEYAHVAQAGLLGTPDYLPFFVAEGGAEYFASLVVGATQQDLAGRFQEAVGDERSNQAVPLRELVERPAGSDARRRAASYSRGYAAMRFLASRWGQDAFGQLHRENVDGSPDRFLEAMRRLTGLTLDEFDAELRTYLLSQATAAASVGRATLVEGSLLTSLVTARRTAENRIETTDRFGRSDRVVLVIFEFACLQRAIRGEARILSPTREPFITFSGTSGPGCQEGASVQLTLDAIVNNRSARTLPGTWTVEIYADGMLQGSITFAVE